MSRGGGASGLAAATLLAMPVEAQPPPRLGAFSQARVVAGPGADGFLLTHARLRASWAPHQTVDVLVQADFVDTPALVDARVQWTPVRAVQVEAGAFKPPFSRNYRTSRQDLLRDDRMRIVRRLVPGRQIGVAVSADVPGTATTLRAGHANGNGLDAEPDDGGPMVFGRVEQGVDLGSVRLDLGANAAWGRDGAADLDDRTGTFAGRRALVGIDAALEAGRLSVAAEALRAVLAPDDAGPTLRPWGLGATAAWRLRPGLYAVASVDHLAADTLATGQWGGAGLRATVGPWLVLHGGAETRLDARAPLSARLTAQVSIR